MTKTGGNSPIEIEDPKDEDERYEYLALDKSTYPYDEALTKAVADDLAKKATGGKLPVLELGVKHVLFATFHKDDFANELKVLHKDVLDLLSLKDLPIDATSELVYTDLATLMRKDFAAFQASKATASTSKSKQLFALVKGKFTQSLAVQYYEQLNSGGWSLLTKIILGAAGTIVGAGILGGMYVAYPSIKHYVSKFFAPLVTSKFCCYIYFVYMFLSLSY